MRYTVQALARIMARIAYYPQVRHRKMRVVKKRMHRRSRELAIDDKRSKGRHDYWAVVYSWGDCL